MSVEILLMICSIETIQTAAETYHANGLNVIPLRLVDRSNPSDRGKSPFATFPIVLLWTTKPKLLHPLFTFPSIRRWHSVR